MHECTSFGAYDSVNGRSRAPDAKYIGGSTTPPLRAAARRQSPCASNQSTPVGRCSPWNSSGPIGRYASGAALGEGAQLRRAQTLVASLDRLRIVGRHGADPSLCEQRRGKSILESVLSIDTGIGLRLDLRARTL